MSLVIAASKFMATPFASDYSKTTMLRLLHTADWHLGHSLHGVSRQPEHQRFLDWLLLELQRQQADALIVAGDIFDSAESIGCRPNPAL